MSQKRFSPEYVKHLQQGPFFGRIDPWAEDAHYFHQIHGTMISNLLDQIQEDLMVRGYVAGREASLQIVAKRDPDIFVEDANPIRNESPRLSYSAIAAQLEVETGTAIIDEDIELDAIRVYDSDSGQLVTVVEIISPSNKSDYLRIERYREQRSRLFLSQGINVVEIDPIRSVQHLIYNKILKSFSYHIAIFLPEDGPYFLGSKLEDPYIPLHSHYVMMRSVSKHKMLIVLLIRQQPSLIKFIRTGTIFLTNSPSHQP